jgi:hypothetical protein
MWFLRSLSQFLFIVYFWENLWLSLAKAKDNWGKKTLTIGKGTNKIVLPMCPILYHGKTQEEDT